MTGQLTVLPFDRTVACDADESILAAVLRQGCFLRYGCRHGGCGTCKVLVVDGDLTESGSSFALTSGERSEGWVLACSALPLGDVVIDVSAMELSLDEFEAGDQITVFDAEVTELERLTPDICGLTLNLVEPMQVSFTAGQFVNVEVPGTDLWRSYSMANAPHHSDRIELIVKLLPGGAFSAYLDSSARIGDRLRVLGPLGELRLRLSHRKVIMVAGGSGLAPFLSILGEMARRGRPRDVELVYGARRRGDLYRLDSLDELAGALPTLDVVPALSEPDGEGWDGETGLVTEVISRRHVTLDGYDAYLAGPPPMIEATVPLLIRLGVRPQNVYYDAFVPAVT